MRILDRYILVSFVKNYVLSLMVLIGLYIVLDMVFNFDEVAQLQTTVSGAGAVTSAYMVIRGLAEFYFFRSFLIFAYLSPIIPVVAAAFTLIRLARCNELTATLAAGVPLLRMATPVVLAAVALNGLLVINQELLIPGMIPQITRKHDQVYHGSTRTHTIRAMQDGREALLNAARYQAPTPTTEAAMDFVDVIRHDGAFMPVSHISADRAQWNARDSYWQLTNGRIATGLGPDERREERPIDVYQGNVTPEEIALYLKGDKAHLLSTRQINELLERPESYGTIDLQRVKHGRFTQWLVNLVLVMLALGTLLSREPGYLAVGLARCVALCAGCMAMIFVTQQMAGTPPAGAQWADRWPALMAWLPVLVFGPVAVWLLDRVRT